MRTSRIERAPLAVRGAKQQDFLIGDFHQAHLARLKLSGAGDEKCSHTAISWDCGNAVVTKTKEAAALGRLALSFFQDIKPIASGPMTMQPSQPRPQ